MIEILPLIRLDACDKFPCTYNLTCSGFSHYFPELLGANASRVDHPKSEPEFLVKVCSEGNFSFVDDLPDIVEECVDLFSQEKGLRLGKRGYHGEVYCFSYNIWCR